MSDDGDDGMVMTEEGGDGVIIGEKQEHPSVLSNQDPHLIWTVYRFVWSIFESHGYVILVGAIATYFLYSKLLDYLEQKVRQKRHNVNEKLDPEEHLARMDAMRRAREKLQAEVDAQAAAETEKSREREEQKRKEKIEDWERHKRGLGYKSKVKAQPTTFKPDTYNALGGGSSSGGSYRPSRPDFSRGGGGGG